MRVPLGSRSGPVFLPSFPLTGVTTPVSAGHQCLSGDLHEGSGYRTCRTSSLRSLFITRCSTSGADLGDFLTRPALPRQDTAFTKRPCPVNVSFSLPFRGRVFREPGGRMPQRARSSLSPLPFEGVSTGGVEREPKRAQRGTPHRAGCEYARAARRQDPSITPATLPRSTPSPKTSTHTAS